VNPQDRDPQPEGEPSPDRRASATDTPGEIRVTFEPSQWPLLLGELQTLMQVLVEAIHTAERRRQPGDTDYIARKTEELRIITQATDHLTRVGPERPFELALPAPLMLDVVQGTTGYAAELLLRQVEELKPAEIADVPAALRTRVEAVSLWTETLLAIAAYESLE
jgi:hypothetical protein